MKVLRTPPSSWRPSGGRPLSVEPKPERCGTTLRKPEYVCSACNIPVPARVCVDVENPGMDGFEAYVAARGPMLLRLAVMLSGNREDANDLVQSALLRVHKHWARISSMGALDAYLRRVVVNEYVSYVRRQRQLFRALHKARPATEVADPTGPLADRAAMWQALGSLPPKQRAVLVLRYYEDLSDEQIADVLHCRATTVRSNASRALRSLREATDGRTKEAWHESARP